MDSFIGRMGGKKLLRKQICEMFPPLEEFDRYIEVFGGAAWVLLYKERHAKMEVYNDLDGEMVNMLRCVKYHLGELLKEMQGFYNSREMHRDIMSQKNCTGLTDIQRAARYFYRIKLSFGMNGRCFSCHKIGMKSAVDKIKEVSSRLYESGVVIENKDFEDLIKVYDREKAFFYCDPPYYKAEKYYDIEFTKSDHERLRRLLGGIKGQFLLSYNDCEYIRELYKDFNICGVDRDNNIGKGRYREVIIRNY